MEIRLSPELEALIRQDLQRGPYESIDQYVEYAVSILHAQEAWLADHRQEIAAKIDEGYAAAKRGELLEPGEVRARLAALKRKPPAKRQRG